MCASSGSDRPTDASREDASGGPEHELARYRALFRSTQDAIVQADARGRIVAWNPAAETMFGYEAEEVLGEPLTRIMPERYRAGHRRGLQRFLDTGEPRLIGETIQLEGQRKDGAEFPVELTLDAWTADGEQHFSGILRDVSEREAARRQLERERAFARMAVAANEADTIDEAFQGTLASVCEETGWPVGHVYWVQQGGSPPLVPADLWHVEDEDRFETFVSATMQTPFKEGEGLPGRVLASGEPAWIEDVTEDSNYPRAERAAELGVRGAFALPVSRDDGLVAVLEFYSEEPQEPDEAFLEHFRPIGEQLARVIEREHRRSQLEEQRRRLERSNDRWKAFGYSLSHDLKEPLRTVKGFGDLLESRHAEDLPEEAREYLAHVTEGVQRMTDLVDGLLEYARVDSKGQALEPVDARELADEAVQSLQARVDETGVEIEVAELGTVVADASQVRRLLQNLVENAITHARSDEPRVRIDSFEPETPGSAGIYVEDNGPGIPEEDREAVFELFHSGEARSGKNMGLGLALCERIVRRHGGDIWVETGDVGGACFCFTLPTRAEASGWSDAVIRGFPNPTP